MRLASLGADATKMDIDGEEEEEEEGMGEGEGGGGIVIAAPTTPTIVTPIMLITMSRPSANRD